MAFNESKINTLLKDLITYHHLVGVKVDFESEGSSFREAEYLKQKVLDLGTDMEFRVKIGGAEAVRDLYDAKVLKASSVIAPMIETPYALEKYINAIDNVFFREEQSKIKFYINIETITGFNNLDKIIFHPLFDRISGVVLGLVDMSRSLGLKRDEMFLDKMFDIAQGISKKIETLGKEMLIGGGTCRKSLSLFSKVSNLEKFETRKLIFDSKKFLADSEINNLSAFIKATEFEILWLENKKEFDGTSLIKDQKRLEMLKSRLSLLEKDMKKIES